MLSICADGRTGHLTLAESGVDCRTRVTTEIEFTIYRSHELRFRAAQALEITFRDGVAPTTEQIVQRVVRNFIPLYQVMLNASQQRQKINGGP